jgi:hypothetical protein
LESLNTHYKKCSEINDTDWAYWVCAYDGLVFDDLDAFKLWLQRFKPHDRYIRFELRREYVTPFEWATKLKRHAMRQHLMAMLLEIPKRYPDFAATWQALNGGSSVPNLDFVTDLPKTLHICSQLIRKKGLRANHPLPIGHLVKLFRIDVNTITEIPPQVNLKSSQRHRNGLLSYVALDHVDAGNHVRIVGNGLSDAQFATNRQLTLETQTQVRHYSQGGVQVSSPIRGSETLHSVPGHPSLLSHSSGGNLESFPTDDSEMDAYVLQDVQDMDFGNPTDVPSAIDNHALALMTGMPDDDFFHPTGQWTTEGPINEYNRAGQSWFDAC